MSGVVPQRVAPFRAGRRLRFVRHVCALFGQAHKVFWTEEPFCVMRWSYDAAALVATLEQGEPAVLRVSSHGPRLMAMAAPRSADGLVIVHEHPEGARIVTTRRGARIGERICPLERHNPPLATDGRRIVLYDRRATTLLRFDLWSLPEPEAWSLAPLAAALGEVGPHVGALQDLGDALLISTRDAWSRWSWDGRLLACWRTPEVERSPYLLAWHPAGPVVHMMMIDPATGRPTFGRDGWHVCLWDLERRTERSLGMAHGWPLAARSPDGRWVVLERVSRAGRGLELWDAAAGTMLERIETRGRAVQALAFAPDGLQVAVATTQDLLVLRIEP